MQFELILTVREMKKIVALYKKSSKPTESTFDKKVDGKYKIELKNGKKIFWVGRQGFPL